MLWRIARKKQALYSDQGCPEACPVLCVYFLVLELAYCICFAALVSPCSAKYFCFIKKLILLFVPFLTLTSLLTIRNIVSMLKKIFTAFISIFLVIAAVTSLSGCTTFKAPPLPSQKAAKNRAFTQISNLPSDYPTRYLPNGSVWQDFSRDMRIPVENNLAVQQQIRWWMNNQGFLNSVLTRGAQYFYYIYQQAKIRNLPAELALLPVFESGYVPVNRSNKGAVGLWQFMPPAARDAGIRMDRYFDGRHDVVVSTNAAFKYLTYLYYYFDRDWLLAIAAYDTGPGNMQKAVLRNKRQGKPINFWSLPLHQETKAYVPKLLALAAILRNPERYGVNVVPINNAPYFSAIKISKQVSLNQAAKLSGASEWSMRMLNAGYVRGVTDPDGLAILLVPKTNAATFKARAQGKEMTMVGMAAVDGKAVKAVVEQLPPSAPLPQSSTVATATTVAAPTEPPKNLPAVVASPSSAKSAVIFTTTASSPQAASKDAANQLAISAALESETLANGSDNGSSGANKVNEGESEDVAGVSAGDMEKSADSNSSRNVVKQKLIKHAVAKGETLLSIARRYNTTPASLRRLNNLRGNSLRLRQILSVQTNSAVDVEVKSGVVRKKGRIVPIRKTSGVSPLHQNPVRKVNAKISNVRHSSSLRAAATKKTLLIKDGSISAGRKTAASAKKIPLSRRNISGVKSKHQLSKKA